MGEQFSARRVAGILQNQVKNPPIISVCFNHSQFHFRLNFMVMVILSDTPQADSFYVKVVETLEGQGWREGPRLPSYGKSSRLFDMEHVMYKNNLTFIMCCELCSFIVPNVSDNVKTL